MKELSILKEKKIKTEKEITISFVIHLCLLALELLVMLGIITAVKHYDTGRVLLSVVVAVLTGLLMYFTSISFLDRVSEILLSFWNCIKIAMEHQQNEYDFVGETKGDHIPRVD